MEREPEQRRDLTMPGQQPYQLGGETFTITEKRFINLPNGKRFELIESVRRGVPFGRDQ